MQNGRPDAERVQTRTVSQRLRALANQPRIVLADEPTGNLDSESGREVFRLLREMNRESHTAFLMVTHDDRLARTADRILQIEDGVIHELNKAEHRRRVQWWE